MSVTVKQILILIALILTVYSNTLDNGFVWDDINLITNNVRIRYLSYIPSHFTSGFFETPTTCRESSRTRYWRPLVLLSFSLDFLFWGDDPFGYHLTNILVHILNVLLVFMLLRSLPNSRPFAFYAALLFGLHPLQTNAVSFISGRTDLLAAAFFLLGCLFFIRYITTQDSNVGCVLGLSLCLALSLMAKEATLTAPLLFLILAAFAKQPSVRRVAKATAASLAVLAAYLVTRALLETPVTEWMSGTGRSFFPRLLAVAESLVIYVQLFLIPVGLHMERFLSLPPPSDPLALFCLFIILFILTAAFISLAHRRIQGAFILWFFIALLPVSNIVPLYGSIAAKQIFLGEQFLYLPLLGLSAAAVFLYRAVVQPGKYYSLMRAAGAVALALLGILAYTHNEYWRDELTFYSQTLRQYPGSVRMCTNLGLLHARQGRYEEGLRLLSMVVEQNPRSARARLNLGTVCRKNGELDTARSEIERALELNTHLATARNELGLIDMAQGRLDDAVTNYKRAIADSPLYVIARVNLASAYMKKDEAEKAIETLRNALVIDPRSLEAGALLAIVYEKRGMIEEAVKQYRALLRHDPNFTMASDKLKQLEK